MKIIKILIIFLFLTAPCIALADDEIKFVPQIGIPGEESKFKTGSEYVMTGDTQPIGEYISSIYSYAVAIVGILAACTLILGGLLWLTAGGSAERVTSAKSWIGSSLTGLLLVICSYLLLSMVNPNLVKFQISGVQKVEPKDKYPSDAIRGCCQTNVHEDMQDRVVCTPDVMDSACENDNQIFSLGKSCAEANCVEKIIPITSRIVCCEKPGQLCRTSILNCNFPSDPGWVLISNSKSCDSNDRFKCKIN